MKILHTSDWHLGRQLYGKKREAEFQSFLNWLLSTLDKEAVEVLIVAGDVFDTSAPSHQSQTQYYHFLTQVAQTTCRHVVIVAGNHDSPSFINAPKALLNTLNIYVVGHASGDPSQEVLMLRNVAQEVELIVCAVPYLRDRDIRTVSAGESVDDKAQKLITGIQHYYDEIAAAAVAKQAKLPQKVPIVATGHLFTAGGVVQENDGVRDLYVGSLGHFPATLFPQAFDYVALGHLHVPQKVAGLEHVRYCGSPIAMGFGEAKQQKQVVLISFRKGNLDSIQSLAVPCFQALAQIKGDWNEIEQQLNQCIASSQSIWVEVIYEGTDLVTDLRERLHALTQASAVEILRIQNTRVKQQVLQATTPTESLDELKPEQVFERCLESHEIPEQQRLELRSAFLEILDSTTTL